MKKPTIPVMIISSAVAVVIAMAIQGFSFSDCAASMVSGFKMEMLHTSVDLENIVEQIPNLLQRGGMFRPEYIKRGLESKNLSRSLEDSITVVEPLVPWSLAGVYMTSVLGVPTVQYAPWAVLCYTGVFFAILWGFTGFGIKKITKDSPAYEEYLQLSGKSAEE